MPLAERKEMVDFRKNKREFTVQIEDNQANCST